MQCTDIAAVTVKTDLQISVSHFVQLVLQHVCASEGGTINFVEGMTAYHDNPSCDKSDQPVPLWPCYNYYIFNNAISYRL